MISTIGLTRRLAAAATAIIAGGGLALAVAGTAQAAVPNRWGFAYVDNPSVPGVPDPARQAGSWPPGFVVHVKPGAIGQVFVRFPRIGGRGGVVLVTAVTAAPVWCQAQKWARSGPNEIVAVRCYRAGGAPVFAPFTVAYSQSSPGPMRGGPPLRVRALQPGSRCRGAIQLGGPGEHGHPGRAGSLAGTAAGARFRGTGR